MTLILVTKDAIIADCTTQIGNHEAHQAKIFLTEDLKGEQMAVAICGDCVHGGHGFNLFLQGGGRGTEVLDNALHNQDYSFVILNREGARYVEPNDTGWTVVPLESGQFLLVGSLVDKFFTYTAVRKERAVSMNTVYQDVKDFCLWNRLSRDLAAFTVMYRHTFKEYDHGYGEEE